MIRADVHNHTVASHGLATVEAMVEAASAFPLDWYGLSEHSPLPPGYSCPLYTGDLATAFPDYAARVLALRERRARASRVPRLLLGMELDWLPANMPWMRGLVARYPFDYVIGGLHFVNDMPVGSPRIWGAEVEREARFARFAAYYEAMTALASSGLVDVVAHPDFVKVCCYEDFQAWLRLPGSLDCAAAALEAMRAADVAMEVSSAGLRKPFAEPYPGPALMRLAADLGLVVSFGSDAHSTSDTVSRFDELAAYAASFGCVRYRVYVDRKPVELTL
ncbi:histidinol-phosphatase HisJ family protein [uncultured Desulfovibrio sp.]|uniref:histidinol-phosphatase HisJ family protein n=1 Tax=uncultured Desulfovibrio sp. TaxID=167968 RepID=UPI00262A4459|nr:histidinol-phosphatase HisJ family protein [uncultured Desulfovibrio sp.]